MKPSKLKKPQQSRPLTRNNDELAKTFNATVRDLITKAEKKTRDDAVLANLDRARQRIKLLKDTLGDIALIDKASPFFIIYSEHLLNPDSVYRETFFLNLDIKEESRKRGQDIDKTDEFVISLVDSLKSMFKKSSENEKNDVHEKVGTLLQCSIEYQINTDPTQ